MIRQNYLYRKSIDTVKPRDIWELFENLPTAPEFVDSGAFFWWKGTYAIVSHHTWGDK